MSLLSPLPALPPLALGGRTSHPANAQIGAAHGALVGNELGKDRDQSKPRR
ncbi:MAG: hypothetical protein I8H87_07595 [Comamonadaceae bacterium]|nr:hypothetical protein [Comamonadaceae bacterium]